MNNITWNAIKACQLMLFVSRKRLEKPGFLCKFSLHWALLCLLLYEKIGQPSHSRKFFQPPCMWHTKLINKLYTERIVLWSAHLQSDKHYLADAQTIVRKSEISNASSHCTLQNLNNVLFSRLSCEEKMKRNILFSR